MKRVTVTIPEATLRQADRRARALRRSRSWVVADALERYLESPEAVVGQGAAKVAEPSAGLGAQREVQLRADLSLTPERRVREAEETSRLAELARPRVRERAVRFFDRYEDWLDWKLTRGQR